MVQKSKYGNSERVLAGSEGLSGSGPEVRQSKEAEKYNFAHWLLKKIHGHPQLSETAGLILLSFLEQHYQALNIKEPIKFITPGEEDILEAPNKGMLKRAVGIGLAQHSEDEVKANVLLRTFAELQVADPADWKKAEKLLDPAAAYIAPSEPALKKIAELASYSGISDKAQDVLSFIWKLQSAGTNLQPLLSHMNMHKPHLFAELMSACFDKPRDEYFGALQELYESGLLESPINNDALPSISAYVLKIEKEAKNLDGMVQKAFGIKRKPEFDSNDFDHVKVMNEKVRSAVRKFIKFPKLAKGILIYGPAGVGKTEYAAVENDGIETWFVGEVEKYEKKLGVTERLSALLLAIKLAGRVSGEGTKKIKLVFDEFEDVLVHFLEASESEDKEQGAYSKLMFNRLLESIKSPVLFLANTSPHRLSDFMVTRLILAEMNAPTGKHQIPIIKRLDERLPIQGEDKSSGTKSGLTEANIEELARSFDTSPRVWGTVVAVACGEPNPLEAARRELQEYTKALVAQRQANAKLTPDFDLRLVNITVADPFNTPVDVYASKLIEKAKAGTPWKLILEGIEGTGKTEYARYLASEIGFGVKVVKASDILFPYTGVAEIKINHLFAQAAQESCLLVFEEADGLLLSRRRAVQDHQISRVNQFNIALDNHTMPSMFLTNLGKELDAATRSRMFVLDFGPLRPDQFEIACGNFFGSELLAGKLSGLKDIVLRDLTNLKKAAELVDVRITPTNIRQGVTCMRNARIATSAIS